MVNLTDNAIIQIFLPVINTMLTTDGFTNVVVKQANQPTMQGINTVPTVYFFKISSKRYGFLGRKDYWDVDTMSMVHLEKQYIESSWQMQALYLQDPTTPDQYTASDLIFEVSSIMQSDMMRNTLNSNGIGILRITDITNPYFTDDRDNFEALPSFDFTIVYENIRQSVDLNLDTFTTTLYQI